MTECNKIAIFAYSWANSKQPKLDGYLNQFALTFGKLGIDVDIFLANQYVDRGGILGTNKHIDFRKLTARLRSKKYDLILSINNALLTEKIGSLLDQPVVSLVVDDFNHLFNHDHTGPYDQFIYADKILFSSHEHLKRLEQNNPHVIGNALFFPTATSTDNSQLKPAVFKKSMLFPGLQVCWTSRESPYFTDDALAPQTKKHCFDILSRLPEKEANSSVTNGLAEKA